MFYNELKSLRHEKDISQQNSSDHYTNGQSIITMKGQSNYSDSNKGFHNHHQQVSEDLPNHKSDLQQITISQTSASKRYKLSNTTKDLQTKLKESLTDLNNKKGINTSSIDAKFGDEDPEWNPKRIFLFTYSRSGSSFTGDVISQNDDVFYFFEPFYYVALKQK